VNSFDQWGVQLGKRLASDLIPAVAGTVVRAPAAVAGAIAAVRSLKGAG
jgi:glucose-6-phosphate isomerase